MKKGKFIVIDGIDGSGKTTQLKLLKKRLKKNNLPYEIADFPQYNTKSAGLVEEYLSGKYGGPEEVGPYIASIFYASDRYDAGFKIKKWLNENKIVLSNRYTSANMGHQGCKIKDKNDRQQYFQWLIDLEFNIFKIPLPDITLILDVDAETSLKLQEKRNREEWIGKDKKDIHENNIAHLSSARNIYQEITKDYPNIVLIKCLKDGKLMPKNKINNILWNKIF